MTVVVATTEHRQAVDESEAHKPILTGAASSIRPQARSLSLFFFLSSFFLLPFSHTSSSSHPSISRSDLLLYHLISFTMFAARSSFNLFQKRAFSASARQVGTAAGCLVNLGRSARINANLFFPFILRPPRSPSLVPVVALASLCPSCSS